MSSISKKEFEFLRVESQVVPNFYPLHKDQETTGPTNRRWNRKIGRKSMHICRILFTTYGLESHILH